MISTIIYITFGEKARSSPRFNTVNIYHSFTMNSAMAAFSSLSCLVGIIVGIVCFSMTDSLTDSRVIIIIFPLKMNIRFEFLNSLFYIFSLMQLNKCYAKVTKIFLFKLNKYSHSNFNLMFLKYTW